MFSGRLPADLRPNALARLREARREIPFDLTLSNPTQCGIPCPDTWLAALTAAEGLVYRPEPLGLESARRAIADDYWRHQVRIDPTRIVLTAGSSEAYAFLFKLLCDPGDSVLAPTPSYPLFEHLAALDGVRTLPYRLDPAGRWQPFLERSDLEPARALIVVHPNIPTGSYVEPRGAESLVALCARSDMALIVDEVFLDYPLTDRSYPSFAETPGALTFTLGGLSKGLGLPQLKLSWIVVSGPPDQVHEALHRLAFIADQYLSVSTPVQVALPRLLAEGPPRRRAIRERCRENLDALAAAAAGIPAVSVLPPQGGWSVVLRYPAVIDEETLVFEMLDKDGVAVYPGYFFDFAADGYLVLSLLPAPEVFAEGTLRLLRRLAERFSPG